METGSGSRVVEVSVEGLRPHEEIIDGNFRALAAQVAMDGKIHTPIIIDRATGTILDGHHRVRVAQLLGICTVPAVLVDYLDDGEVILDSWRDGEVIQKSDVVSAATTGRLMPPKTTRHRILREAA